MGTFINKLRTFTQMTRVSSQLFSVKSCHVLVMKLLYCMSHYVIMSHCHIVSNVATYFSPNHDVFPKEFCCLNLTNANRCCVTVIHVVLETVICVVLGVIGSQPILLFHYDDVLDKYFKDTVSQKSKEMAMTWSAWSVCKQLSALSMLPGRVDAHKGLCPHSIFFNGSQ